MKNKFSLSTVIYCGTKTGGSLGSNLEIIMIQHKNADCLEVGLYNSMSGLQAPNMYFRYSALSSSILENKTINDHVNIESNNVIFSNKNHDIETVKSALIEQEIVKDLFARFQYDDEVSSTRCRVFIYPSFNADDNVMLKGKPVEVTPFLLVNLHQPW